MNRTAILSQAMFDTGGELDGVKFGPISPPVLAILKRRKNTLVLPGNGREQDSYEAIGEILFVLSRSKDDRQAMFRISASEWDDKVVEFIAGLDDKTLEKFGSEYLQPAMEAVQAAAVESEEPGKPESAIPVTSRSSSPAHIASDSTP